MANKYLARDSSTGIVGQVEAMVVSSGVSDAGKIPALDGTGRFDETVMPLGVGPDVELLEATEDLASGCYVNIFLSAGIAKARLADGSNGREADGFVKEGYTTGQTAVIYSDVPNENLTGLTIAARYYLGVAGGVTAVPRLVGIHQFLGKATAATVIDTSIEDKIVLV